MDTPVQKLLLVYDAGSSKWDLVVDGVKKLLSLSGCTLCDVTHGLTGERAAWRDCKDALGVSVEYIHRDELTPALRAVATHLPCVVALAGDELISLLSPDVLAQCQGSVTEFRGRLYSHAAARGLAFPSVSVARVRLSDADEANAVSGERR